MQTLGLLERICQSSVVEFSIGLILLVGMLASILMLEDEEASRVGSMTIRKLDVCLLHLRIRPYYAHVQGEPTQYMFSH